MAKGDVTGRAEDVTGPAEDVTGPAEDGPAEDGTGDGTGPAGDGPGGGRRTPSREGTWLPSPMSPIRRPLRSR